MKRAIQNVDGSFLTYRYAKGLDAPVLIVGSASDSASAHLFASEGEVDGFLKRYSSRVDVGFKIVELTDEGYWPNED